ncbi:PIN/TRAM domain-containing protein [Caloranaerobacter sp. DY30410]|uniref:PIN/TRAM domain-containing protein n=1 Tax=Caloranaerobacter sp. DY30410 TaxID=3238305 RepID=UPI003D071122
MVQRIIRAALTVFGILLGYGIVSLLYSAGILNFIDDNLKLYVYISTSLIFGIIFYIAFPKLLFAARSIANSVEGELQQVPATDIVLGSIGLIVGLIIAYLSSQPFFNLGIPYLGVVISILLYLLFGYLGIIVPTKKREDFFNVLSVFKRAGSKDKAFKGTRVQPKILDTSVIIDGRIADICKTGFIEGPLVIPEFVLEELRHIADSSDGLKRNRGRRGLDILNKIQKEIDIEVIIYDKDFEDINEVDSKLLKLAQILKGKVVTNDFNLNKVAEFQGVDVLNINELANAVKPVVLPGEEMIVQVIKDGKESGQGVAYLDDGTMIVVDGGKKHIGETIGVMVTSVLQTAAGRMIFAKPKSMVDKAV